MNHSNFKVYEFYRKRIKVRDIGDTEEKNLPRYGLLLAKELVFFNVFFKNILNNFFKTTKNCFMNSSQ